jgi:hypothetical protein
VDESHRGFLRTTFNRSAVETAASVPTLGRVSTGSFVSTRICPPLSSLRGSASTPSLALLRCCAAVCTRGRTSRLGVTYASYNRYWARNFVYSPVRGLEALRATGVVVDRVSVTREVAVLM